LRVAVAVKIGDALYLMLNQTPMEEWYNEITSFWKQLRDSKIVGNAQGREKAKKRASVLNAEAKVKCFRCRCWGHATRDCTKPRRQGKKGRKRYKRRRLLKRLKNE